MKETPVGNAPDSLIVGAGKPVAVTVNEPAVPTANVAFAALVMVGGRFTVSLVLVLVAEVSLLSPRVAIGDRVRCGGRGNRVVGNISENWPFAPTVAFRVVPLMATDTVSPLDGYTGPGAEIVPERVIDAAPNEMACEGVSPLNADASACTVMVVMVRYCWLFTVTVAALVYVPAPAEALVTWRLALAPDAKVPNEQLNIWLPTAPVIRHVPGPR